jgi:hypothetical protein
MFILVGWKYWVISLPIDYLFKKKENMRMYNIIGKPKFRNSMQVSGSLIQRACQDCSKTSSLLFSSFIGENGW